MTNNPNIIYGLFCPFTDEIYYVGKTTAGISRPLKHLTKSHSAKVNEWVDGLKELGHVPDVKILESVESADELREKEQYWVYKFVSQGKRLLNIDLVKPAAVLLETKRRMLSTEVTEVVPIKPTQYLADFVRKKRKQCRLNQQELADKAGVGLRFVRELEAGKLTLRIDKVHAVLHLFGAVLIPHQTTPL